MRGLTPKVLFAIIITGASAVAAPQIDCENPVYQFGTMDSSSTVKTSFVIQNTGDEPLEFTKVRNCCGVSSQLSGMTIPSGSNAVLSVDFNLEGRKGPQLKTIYLISNDPQEPFYKIRLMGRVVPAQEARPILEEGVQANDQSIFAEKVRSDTTVLIDFFYEPGCHDCEKIEAELLPKVEKRFGGHCVVYAHDIGIETNFITLLQLENSTGHAGPERAYLIVNKQFVFGPNPSHKEFLSLISKLLEQGAESAPVVLDSENLAEERFDGFTLSAVLVAGILDGINPCAISTLVFFMSLLAVSKVRNQQLILLGISFCLASFATYLALGFGLLRILHLFSVFKTVRAAIEWGMVAILLVLASLSFRDAVRFRKSRDAHDVTLQLSSGMKQRIHGVMRRGLKTGHLVLGGLFIGATVTALESVCTGQVYVPTLVLILKDNALAESRAWLYLLAYNLMFILPLLLTFTAVYFGLRTDTLLAWSRKNVAFSKVLLGMFFVVMSCLIMFF